MIIRNNSKKGWAAVYVVIIVMIALVVFVINDKNKKAAKKSTDHCFENLKQIEAFINETIKKNHKKLLLLQNISPAKWLEMTKEDHEFPKCPDKGKYILSDNWSLTCSFHKDISKDLSYLKKEIRAKTIIISSSDIKTKDIIYLNKARNSYSLKNFKKALKYFLLAIKENPKDPEYHYWAANCFNIIKNFQSAKQEIEKAISIKPTKKYSELSANINDNIYFNNLLSPYSNFYIIYVAKNPDGFDSIKSLSLDGQKHFIIKDNYTINSLTKMNNSPIIVFSEKDNIRTMNLDGSNEKIIHKNMKYPCYNIAVSPNDNYILFNSTRFEPGVAIFMKDLFHSINESDCTKIIGAERQPGKPIWIDNSNIIFLSGYDSMAEICKYNVFSKDVRPEKITNNVFIEENISFIPQLNSVSFSSRYFMKDDKGKDIPSAREIYLYNLTTNKRSNISRSVFDEDNSNWSPDGSLLAFTEMNKNYEKDIFVMSPDGRNKRRATFFKADSEYNDFYSKISFIPGTNDLLLFSYGSTDKKNLYVSDLKNGKSFQLTESLSDDTMFFIIKK